MGTLGGHVAPGAFFFLIGLWHLFGHTRLFLLQRSSYVAPVWFPVPGVRHTELMMIILGSLISISMELVIVQPKHQPLDDDGSIPSAHLHNFEHASISLAWLVFAAAAIHMDRVRAPLRDAVSQLLAAAAFAQQLLIFHFHSADHAGVQGRYHRLLEMVIAVALAASLLLIRYRRSIVLSLVRAASLVFQGVWFAVMGVMMWTPAFVPKGCFIDDEDGGLQVVRCRTDEALRRAKSLVTLQFNWYLTGTVALVVVFYLQLAKHYQEQEQEQAQYAPLVKGGSDGRRFSIGEVKDDEDHDLEASGGGLGCVVTGTKRIEIMERSLDKFG